jgi:hypothetical protein
MFCAGGGVRANYGGGRRSTGCGTLVTMKNTIFPTRFQVCAICGKRHAPTHKFPFLARYGIKGKYAAMDCPGPT